MAIAYGSYVAGGISGGGTSVAVTNPSPGQAGIVFCVLAFGAGNPGAILAPSGWTFVVGRSAAPYHYCYSRVMDGTEGTALGTFSWPNTLIMACWTVSYPGAGLIRANSTMVGYTTANPTITIPEIRANSGDKLVTFVIAAVGGGSASVGTIGAVYGETRRFSNTQAGGTSKRQLAVSDEVLGSTGATGTRTCAITGQFASNFSDAGFMVALGVSAPVTSSESMQMNIY